MSQFSSSASANSKSCQPQSQQSMPRRSQPAANNAALQQQYQQHRSMSNASLQSNSNNAQQSPDFTPAAASSYDFSSGAASELQQRPLLSTSHGRREFMQQQQQHQQHQYSAIPSFNAHPSYNDASATTQLLPDALPLSRRKSHDSLSARKRHRLVQRRRWAYRLMMLGIVSLLAYCFAWLLWDLYDAVTMTRDTATLLQMHDDAKNIASVGVVEQKDEVRATMPLLHRDVQQSQKSGTEDASFSHQLSQTATMHADELSRDNAAAATDTTVKSKSTSKSSDATLDLTKSHPALSQDVDSALAAATKLVKDTVATKVSSAVSTPTAAATALYTPYHAAQPMPEPFHLNGNLKSYNKESEKLTKPAAKLTFKPSAQNIVSFRNPSESLQLRVHINKEGALGYSLLQQKDAAILIEPSYFDLRLEFKPCTFAMQDDSYQLMHSVSRGSSLWRPVPGAERQYYSAEWTRLDVWCEGETCQHCPVHHQFKLFESAMSHRVFVRPLDASPIATIDDETDKQHAHVHYSMRVNLKQALQAQCWAANLEEPYEADLKCSSLRDMMTPVTMQPSQSSEPQHFISLLQSDAPAVMRSTVNAVAATDDSSSSTTLQLDILTKGEAALATASDQQLGVELSSALGLATPTSWNLIVLARSPAHLSHQAAALVPLLCRPPLATHTNQVDSRWIGFGKSLRARAMTTVEARQIIDFAVTHNYQLLHFDAGWYGDEYSKTSSALAIDKQFVSNLDFKQVTDYAHSQRPPILVSVYVNEIALRDTVKLAPLYRSWGLDGVKFGFVDVQSPRAMRVLHERILTFAQHNIWINIHDMVR